MSEHAALLFVCQANMCRSPMAERLTRLALAGRTAPITVTSAGTHAEPGAPMHPGAVRALIEVGADVTGFGSRSLSAALLSDADLVLTATRAQRAHCVTLVPAALGRTFTIRQLGRLAATVAPDRLAGVEPGARVAALLAEVARVRGAVQPVPADHDDLADPVYGGAADMRGCLRQIQLSLAPVLALIAPA